MSEALLARILADIDPPPPIETDPRILETFIDWDEFWTAEHTDEDWLIRDQVALGRSHAVYAAHKSGKSLWALWVAVHCATKPEPCNVIYLDWEMSDADLRERIEDLGHDIDSDLSHLHYALLPTIPPLDTAEGAAHVARILDHTQSLHPPDTHTVVIIDTTSRALQGDENDASTIQNYYRHTGLMLKQTGATIIRIDHAGKASDKGQRGSSAKGDDVDVIWKLIATDQGVTLKRDAARMGWVGDKTELVVTEFPRSYVPANSPTWPAGTKEMADILDAHGIGLDATTREAQDTLRAVGVRKRRQIIVTALRWRREEAEKRELQAKRPDGDSGRF